MPPTQLPGPMAEPLDLAIIGGGIGGVICLHYARKAGLNVLLFEKQGVVGGLWATLPSWQDIQFPRKDWTLGDLPIEGEDQQHILKNIQSWVDKFDLTPYLRLNTPVERASTDENGWVLSTPGRTYRSRYLVAATGAHNRPFIPHIDRLNSSVREFHSCALREPREIRGRDVVVVGGGASAYDLLDLCIEHEAHDIAWVYRSLRWMVPTRKPKSMAGGIRDLARQQVQGLSSSEINQRLFDDMRGRYEKFGLQEILPEGQFDLGRDQVIPGRRGMIEHFSQIRRYRGEISQIVGNTVHLSCGDSVDADLLLWGTGYDIDLSYFASPALAGITKIDGLARRCGCVFRSLDEPNLFFLAMLLESTTVGPWIYAVACKSIIAHISGKAHFDMEPTPRKINHFELPKFLAERDPDTYPPGAWFSALQQLVMAHPDEEPLPIP